MGQLDQSNIYSAWGKNGQGSLVYYFFRFKDEGINCILGDNPLKGFWAWPRDHDDRASPESDEDQRSENETSTDQGHVEAGVADQETLA